MNNTVYLASAGVELPEGMSVEECIEKFGAYPPALMQVQEMRRREEKQLSLSFGDPVFGVLGGPSPEAEHRDSKPKRKCKRSHYAEDMVRSAITILSILNKKVTPKFIQAKIFEVYGVEVPASTIGDTEAYGNFRKQNTSR